MNININFKNKIESIITIKGIKLFSWERMYFNLQFEVRVLYCGESRAEGNECSLACLHEFSFISPLLTGLLV